MPPQRPRRLGSVDASACTTVGERLKLARECQGLTQKEVVQALNWRWRKKLSRFETGESHPSLDDAAALADFYGTSIDWLAGRCGHTSGIEPGAVVAERAIVDTVLEGDGLDPRIDPQAIRPRPFTVPDDPVVLPREHGRLLMQMLGEDGGAARSPGSNHGHPGASQRSSNHHDGRF